MRTITFKGLFLTVLFVLLGSLTILAAEDGLITKQITIKLDKAGTLADKIGKNKIYKITNLKIIGEVNGKDWQLIRDMAGGSMILDNGPYINSETTDGNLNKLDLSEVQIVEDDLHEYGKWYGKTTVNYEYVRSTKAIPRYMFKHCYSLKELIIPSYVTQICSFAFESCGLQNIVLNEGLEDIGEGAFNYCSGLTSLTLPSSITTIGKGAFSNCKGLSSLTLPSGVTTIGDKVFENCSGLKEVNFCINEGLETYLQKSHPYIDVDCGIKYYLNDKEITSIEIPSNVTSLGRYVFQKCSGLTSLNIPDGVSYIGNGAFDDCTGLTSLTIPSSLTTISNNAFSGCSALKEVSFCINDDLETYLTKGHPYIKVDCGINYYLNDKKVTTVVIPSSVTSLGNNVFQKCSTLQSVYVNWSTPISAGKAFNEVDVSKCTLYVPQGTETDYFLVDVWGDFGNIVEYDPTGIDKVTISTDAKELSRYSVNGQRLSAPAKGLNIVKYSDGSVKKVVVQ